MFKATGPGKIEVDSKYSSPGMLKALLYNFDFDDMRSEQVKAEHALFLSDHVAPLLRDDQGHIWLRGSASQIGAATYNQVLSKKRVERVAHFLAGRGVNPSQMQLEAVGEQFASKTKVDDERDRSVAFIVLPKIPGDQPPPPEVPSKPLVSQRFKVRMLGGGAFSKPGKVLKLKPSAGVAVDVIAFQIWDTTNNLASIYVYTGGGAGAGFYWVSTTHVGPWNDFQTSAPISSAQFGGFTRFTTGGAGPHSINFLNMVGTPPGVKDVYIEFFETGLTVGAGVSSTVGPMFLVDGPGQFKGE